MKTLIIDNYDSFTFNLYQLVARVNRCTPWVVRNDGAAWAEVAAVGFDNIIVSPGPGRPDRVADFGIAAEALAQTDVPVLGVCLGHQGLAQALGATVVRAPRPIHGQVCCVHHDTRGLFAGIPTGFSAVRYHSLMVDPDSLPDALRATAWTQDGILMAIEHRDRPKWGVQFHPESVCTDHGARLLENFRDLSAARRIGPRRRVARSQVRSVVPAGRARPQPSSQHRLVWTKLDAWRDAETVFMAAFASASTFWLDSSSGGTDASRFSFMGDAQGPLAVRLSYDADQGCTRVCERGGARVDGRSVFEVMREILAQRFVCDERLPFDFQCGFVGYLGYELKRDCGGDPGPTADEPAAQMSFIDRLVAFDHVDNAIYLVALVTDSTESEAQRWLARMRRTITDAAPILHRAHSRPPAAVAFGSSHSRERVLESIAACQAAIAHGETYEVCLTRQITANVAVSGLSLHRELRRANPAPYAAYLKFEGLEVVSSSPERFLRIDRAACVESAPIKGTRRRGIDPAEDARLAAELRSSPKDRAENLMIVDLVRNDLGAVCEVGSVTVPSLMRVESYATVHQLVSTVQGRLRSDVDAIDCLKSAFPPGSMTGAPKRRTMQILGRLEGRARGVYSGAIGYLSCSRALDLSVVIRTVVVRPDRLDFGVGGAIIALSDPSSEVEEADLKASALMSAISRVAGDECGGGESPRRANREPVP